MKNKEPTNSQIMKRLEKIDIALRPVPDKYWTQADIGAKLQVSEATVRRMLKAEDAPKPIAAATDSDGQMMKPRYNPERIIRWLEDLDRLGQSSRRAKSAASGL